MRLKETHKFDDIVRYNDLDMYSVAYHPNYFVFVDKARNQSYSDYGYPIAEQLKDKVGFTIRAIDNVNYYSPLFIDDKITVLTECIKSGKTSCVIKSEIYRSNDKQNIETAEMQIVFSSLQTLVFVSIEEISSLPLGQKNIHLLKVIPFNEKARNSFSF